MVQPEHVASIVRTAVQGPAGLEVSPSTAWRGVSFALIPDAELYALPWPEHAQHMLRVDYSTGEQVGDMLRAENVESLLARYPEGDMVPGWALLPFCWGLNDGRRLTAVEALSALDCFGYQACEHEGWTQSSAFRFCESFRRALIGCLDGYSWNVDYGPALIDA